MIATTKTHATKKRVRDRTPLSGPVQTLERGTGGIDSHAHVADFRRQIVAEAKEEIEAKKAEAKKPRRTRVLVVEDPKPGIQHYP